MTRYWLALLCLLSVGCNHEPVGVELIYAVDPEQRAPGDIGMQKVLDAVQRRIGHLGTAELVDDQIKIGVFGSDRRKIDLTKKLIDRAGLLEFRILADRRFDGKLIDLATQKELAGERDVRKKAGD